jgi:tetratricopeptide (TPR) repeat protein
MSSKKRRTEEKLSRTPPGRTVVAAAVEDRPNPQWRMPWWVYAVGIAVIAFFAFEVYGPALNGRFIFDDEYLPFTNPQVQNAPLMAWLGVRPFLMLSYWFNYKTSGLEPYAYHAVNLLFHVASALLAWLIVRKLLRQVHEKPVRREILAAFAGGLFLLHPVQTESVAYVASRSEAMSVFFFLAAYAVFLFRKTQTITFARSIVVLILFFGAASSKEHTVVLPALLLLTDFFFNTPFRFEGIKKNIKLYGLMAVGAVAGLIGVWRVLGTATTAGFAVKEFKWYEYLFTQFGVIWTYIRLYVLPINQNGDYDWSVARPIYNLGSMAGLAGLLAGLFLAWRFRREFPLASFGFLGLLVLLAPTSSVVPIRDIITERRLYLPFICLLLITVDFLRRWRPSPAMMASALALVLAVSGFATWKRNHVWAAPLPFWQDVVEKSPANARAWFQLAYAQWQEGRCAESVTTYEKVARMQKADERLLVDWALALDCVDRVDEAVAKLHEAAAVSPTALVYAQIGMVNGKRGRNEAALAALERAEKIDPSFDMTYVYRGNVYMARGEFAPAAEQYRRALGINPHNSAAEQSLAIAEQRVARPR